MMRYDIFKYPRLREDKDLSRKDIASYLKVTPNTYSRYETGTYNIPLDALEKLADYYNTSVDYLLSRTDIKSPYPRKPKK